MTGLLNTSRSEVNIDTCPIPCQPERMTVSRSSSQPLGNLMLLIKRNISPFLSFCTTHHQGCLT